MKLIHLTSKALFCIATSLSLLTGPPAVAQQSSQAAQPVALTRAEVLADLQVWRQSGLAQFELEHSYAPHTSREYLAARARYQQMRTSPEFESLVRAIASRRGEALPRRVASAERQP